MTPLATYSRRRLRFSTLERSFAVAMVLTVLALAASVSAVGIEACVGGILTASAVFSGAVLVRASLKLARDFD